MFLVIDGDIFGFDNKGNIPIKDEDYDLFFDMQKEGKQFKLKDIPTGTGLFDYIEEYIPEVVEEVPEPGSEEIALDHEYRISKLELGV